MDYECFELYLNLIFMLDIEDFEDYLISILHLISYI